MAENSTQKKVVQAILQDLESDDSKVILDALKRIKSKGDASVIPCNDCCVWCHIR